MAVPLVNQVAMLIKLKLSGSLFYVFVRVCV